MPKRERAKPLKKCTFGIFSLSKRENAKCTPSTRCVRKKVTTTKSDFLRSIFTNGVQVKNTRGQTLSFAPFLGPKKEQKLRLCLASEKKALKMCSHNHLALF